MKYKNLLLIPQLFLTSSLLAGGSSGGTPPAISEESQESALLNSELLSRFKPGKPLIDEIKISREAMNDAIRAAMENREIPVEIGSRLITVKPLSFDFVKKHMNGSILENGAQIILKEAVEAE